MKLVIEVELDGILDNCHNFHEFMKEFLPSLAELIPKGKHEHFSSFWNAAPKGPYNSVIFTEARTREMSEPEGSEVVVARSMLLDAPFNRERLADLQPCDRHNVRTIDKTMVAS